MDVTKRIADLSMIWKQVSLVFPYFDQRNIDWDEAYRAYLPKVINAETEREFHLLLSEFINLLGDGHTEYLPPKSLQEEVGYLPFALRWVENGCCIDAVLPEYQSYSGAQVLSINGAPFETLMEEASRYVYHVGNCVSRYRIHQILPFFLKRTGNRMDTSAGSFSFDLLSARAEHLVPHRPELSEPYRNTGTGKLDIRLYDGQILYVKMDDFLYDQAADEVRTALEQTPGVSGVILDLRENVGGMTMYGAKVAELFLDGLFHGCQKRTRSMTGIALSSASQIIQWSEEAIEKHIAAGYSTREEIEESKSYMANTHYDQYVDSYGGAEHTALFRGPCVILTSRHTVSAAEDFVAMFRTNRRATVVGSATCGTTGTPLMQDLSCGGWFRVCSVGYRLLDGTEFVGCGIRPDIRCEVSADQFRRGYDAVLARGLDTVKQLISQEASC